jgi:hypothetical protein
MTRFFKSVSLEAIAIGDRYQVWGPTLPSPVSIDKDSLAILNLAGAFTTLQAVIRALEQNDRKVIDRGDFNARVERLEQEGLLTWTDSGDFDADNPDSAEPSIIDTTAIPSCDRPELLRRCLSSFHDAARLWNKSMSFVVAESSTDQRHRSDFAALQAQELLPKRLRWIGGAERERFITALRLQGFETRLLKFALDPGEWSACAIGANRNCITLDSIGVDYLSVDDDVECRVFNTQSSVEGCLLLQDIEPLGVYAASDRKQLLFRFPPVDIDIWARHEENLGKRVLDCLANAGPVVAPSTLNAFDLRGPGLASRILLSRHGLIGDSGLSSLDPVILAGIGNHKVGQTTDQALSLLRDSREACRSMSSMTFSRDIRLSTFGVAFSKHLKAPPFFPILRNEDSVFGRLLRNDSPQAMTAHHPFALLHNPPMRNVDHICLANAGPRTSDLLMWLFGSHTRIEADYRSLKTCGQLLIDLTNLPLISFANAVRQMVWSWLRSRLASIDRRLSGCSKDESTLRELLYARQTSILQLLTQDPNQWWKPRDITLMNDPTMESLQNAFRSFGQLLTLWPEITEAVGYLKSNKGLRLSARL